MYRGDIRLGDTIDLKFTTRSFSTGAPTQLAGTPVISAYPNNSTTQITAGITLTVDFDTVTGLNNVRVVATSGNGYATATNYDLVITTGTVGGVSVVGEVIGSFSIEARSALMPTTAARTLDVSAGGEAGLDWANIGSPTTAVNLSGTNIDTDQVVASVTGAVGSVTGAVGSVTGNVGGNVTGSVGSVTGLTNATIADAVWDEDATAHQTQGTFGQAIGDPGADTDTIFGLVNTNLDATISSRLATAGYTAPPSAASVADAVWDEAQADHVAAGSFGVTASEIADILVDTAEIGVAGAGLTNINLPDQTMNITGDITGNLSGSVGSVTGSVGSVAAGGITASSIAADAIGASELAADAVAEIADAVWDELLAGHAGAGSAGEALAAAGTAGDPWTTALPGAYGAGTAGNILGNNLNATVSSRASQTSVDTIDDFLDTEIAAILADTNELQTDWVNGGRLDLLVDAIKAKTDNLPAAPAATSDIPSAATIADAVWDEDATAHQTQGTFGQAIGDPGVDTDTIFGLLNTNLDATVSSRAAQSTVNTIDSATTAIQAKTDSLTFTVAGVVDANIQRINDVALVGTGVLGDEFRP